MGPPRREAWVLRGVATRFIPAGIPPVLVMLVALLMHNVERREVAPTELEREPQTVGSPEAGAAGMGDEAVASVAPAETSRVFEESISREVPPKPVRGQRRPPCTQRAAVEINGGCWRPVVEGADTAPCDEDLYEYKGRCYTPVRNTAEPVPTSEEPW